MPATSIAHPPVASLQSVFVPRYRLGDVIAAHQPVDAYFGEDMFYRFGENELLTIADKDQTRHLGGIGDTGAGKSFFMLNLARQRFMAGRGFAILDPNNSMVRDFIAWVAYHRDKLGLMVRKTYVVDLDHCFLSLDPREAYLSDDPDHYLTQTQVGEETKQDVLIRELTDMTMVKRGETTEDQQLQKRRRRSLRALFACLSVRVDELGGYLPFSAMWDLIDPRSLEFDDLHRLVDPHLPTKYQQFFANLRTIKQRAPHQVETAIESTLTQLDEVFTPALLHCLDSKRAPLPVEWIVRNDGVLLVCGGKTTFVHEDVGIFLQKCLLKMVTNALRRIPEHDRGEHPFYVDIDECHNLIDDSTLSLLKEGRKYRISAGLYTQQLEALKHDYADLFSAFFNLCNIVVVFRTGFFDDAYTCAQSIYSPFLDFTPLEHEVERFGGYEYVLSPSFMQGQSDSQGVTLTSAESHQVGTSRAIGHTFAKSLAKTWSNSMTLSKSQSESWLRSLHESQSRAHTDVAGTALTLAESNGISTGIAGTEGVTTGHNVATGFTTPMGPGSDTHNTQTADSTAKQNSTSRSESESHQDSKARSETESHADQSGFVQGQANGFGGAVNQGVSYGFTDGTTLGASQAVSDVRSTSEMIGRSLAFGRSLTQSNNTSVTFSLSPLALPPKLDAKDTRFTFPRPRFRGFACWLSPRTSDGETLWPGHCDKRMGPNTGFSFVNTT